MKKLLALVVAGVAVKYFLDSKQGKQVQNQVKDWLGEAQDAFKDSIHQAKGTIDKTINKVDQTLPGVNG